MIDGTLEQLQIAKRECENNSSRGKIGQRTIELRSDEVGIELVAVVGVLEHDQHDVVTQVTLSRRVILSKTELDYNQCNN